MNKWKPDIILAGTGQWTYDSGELCRQEMSRTPDSSQSPASQHSVNSDPPRRFRQRLGFLSSCPYRKMDTDALHFSSENSGCWGGRMWSEWPRWTTTQVMWWCQQLCDASQPLHSQGPSSAHSQRTFTASERLHIRKHRDSHPDVHLSPVQGRIKTTSLGNSEDNCILTCFIRVLKGAIFKFLPPRMMQRSLK